MFTFININKACSTLKTKDCDLILCIYRYVTLAVFEFLKYFLIGGSAAFGVGCKYDLGPDASIRAKVDNSSKVNKTTFLRENYIKFCAVCYSHKQIL